MAAKDSGDRSTEIMAAVGAGMLPATMAMLMPMVLGRRRRKRRDIHHTIPLLSDASFHHIDPHQIRFALKRLASENIKFM